MFVYHFVDTDPRVETFFEKDGAAENGSVDVKIDDTGAFTHFAKIPEENFMQIS